MSTVNLINVSLISVFYLLPIRQSVFGFNDLHFMFLNSKHITRNQLARILDK